jgi:hypothetical protein
VKVAGAARELRDLARVTGESSRRHGAGRLWAARRARMLRGRGFEYDEAVLFGLMDPAVPADLARRFVSEYETTRLIDALNAEALSAVTAEKVIFYRHFSALGVAVPELYGAVGRAGGWSAVTGRPLADPASSAAFLAAEVPEEFVMKPSGGHHGLGVRVLRRDGHLFSDLEGRRWDAAGLVAEILADPDFDLHVVQERLRNHPDLQVIFASETLQTTRMTTFASDDGTVEVVHGSFKVGAGGGNVDNFRSGATGNVLVEIDLGTGALGRPFGDSGRGGVVEGAVLPDWAAACELARESARHLLPQRSMGLDVALTTRGPVLVEANRGYDPFPSAGFGDAVRAMERATREGGPLQFPG